MVEGCLNLLRCGLFEQRQNQSCSPMAVRHGCLVLIRTCEVGFRQRCLMACDPDASGLGGVGDSVAKGI